MWRINLVALLLAGISNLGVTFSFEISPSASLLWGPGLSPDKIVMPARYFFIHAVDVNTTRLEESPGNIFTVNIHGESQYKNCRVWVNVLDRKDGSFIVRYKLYHTCYNLEIHVKCYGKNVASSPYKFKGPVYSEDCYCPLNSPSEWLLQFGCNADYEQIISDLKPFPAVNFTQIRNTIVDTFNRPGSTSICNYVIKNNKVYRKCYGKYVGFKMFMDAILLSLSRKVHLPDTEFFMNLGDWPLISNKEPKVPMFAWCGSDDTLDIVLPTYDITEATLECMGRVMLDMLSVQGNILKKWDEKINKAFWRGRDSRRERLKLIDISRKYPELFNASITNFFFFKEEEEYYGPKEKPISFFRFFDYKYLVNIDGTVAAYRFPYLLAGDSLIFKQDSKYYEHFYKQLKPWQHYVPIDRNLEDLVEKLLWAKENDATARVIAENGQKFSRDNLMPKEIFCYHVALLQEWSRLVISEIEVRDDMEHVPQPVPEKPYGPCDCETVHSSTHEIKLLTKDEL